MDQSLAWLPVLRIPRRLGAVLRHPASVLRLDAVLRLPDEVRLRLVLVLPDEPFGPSPDSVQKDCCPVLPSGEGFPFPDWRRRGCCRL